MEHTIMDLVGLAVGMWAIAAMTVCLVAIVVILKTGYHFLFKEKL